MPPSLTPPARSHALMVTGESDEWTDDGHVALHALPTAEHYAILLDSFLLK